MVETGGEGADTLVGTLQDDTLRGGAGNDQLTGDAGDDLLEGGVGDDRLEGGVGDDRLEGGVGDDTLRGDRGFDTLIGGAGDDTYLINNLDDYWVEEADGGFDRLIVSVNGAKIDLTNIERVEYVDDALPLAYWVDALVYGISWDLMGEPVTVRYAYLANDPWPGFQAMDGADHEIVRQALAIWAAPTQLSWQEVAPEQADVLFGFADLSADGAAGLTDYGGASNPTHVYIDLDATGGQLGSDYWFDVLLHETGHALWLKHPGDYNGSDGQGEPPFLPTVEDNDDYTVMSYHDGPSGRWARQLRPLDIAAAQYLYGVNPAINGGDTLFRADELTWPFSNIQDGGGNDTLDASGWPVGSFGAGVSVDLRSGALSRLGRQSEGFVGGPAMLTIGYHSVIENVVGSAGADDLVGNRADNQMQGGAGQDLIDGLAGSDTLLGGPGDDHLIDRLGEPNRLEGGDGDDTLDLHWGPTDGGVPRMTISGDAGVDTLVLRLPDTGLTEPQVKLLAELMAGRGVSAGLALECDGIESVRLATSYGFVLQNIPPFVFEATLTVDEDGILEGQVPEAIDLDGTVRKYWSLGGALHGQVTGPGPGDGRSFRYQPQADFFGEELLRYEVSDDMFGYSSGTLRIVVSPVDDAPVLHFTPPDVSATVGQTLSVGFDAAMFTDIDTPTIRYSLSRPDGKPLPGWLSFDPAALRLVGTPAAGDAGLLELRLWANVDAGAQASAYVDFLLGTHPQTNHAPEASAGLATIDEDHRLDAEMPRASDADGDPLGYRLAREPAHGRLQLSGDGSFRYEPDADFHGEDYFEAHVFDGRGGSTLQRFVIGVVSANDPPVGEFVADGTAVPGALLMARATLADVDGGVVTPFEFRWTRNGVERLRETGQSSLLLLDYADAGARIAVELRYVDGEGFVNTMRREWSEAVAAVTRVQGSGAAESLSAGGRSAWVLGMGGDDTLYGSYISDSLEGGDGNDRIVPDTGFDTIDGGEGWDILVVRPDLGGLGPHADIDLRAGFADFGPVQWQVRGIEAVVATRGNDRLRGGDGPATTLDNAFVAGGGFDTIDGGGGLDWVQIEAAGHRARITRSGELVQVAISDGVAIWELQLTSIERLRFDDVYLAFGPRAEEVAKVAFALWNPAIASSRYLFARGISYYDVGYSYETLIDAALGFFTSDSEQQFAERLAGNVPSGRSAVDILALMRDHGGAGVGQAGRGWATKLVADEAANLHNIELAGFISNGIACDLVVDGSLLFAPLGG